MCDRGALNPKFVLVFCICTCACVYSCICICFVFVFLFVFLLFPVFVFVLVFVPVFVPVFAPSQVAAGGSKCVRGNWGVCSEFCLKFVFGPKQQSVPCIRHIIMECNFLCCFCQSVNDVNGIPLLFI